MRMRAARTYARAHAHTAVLSIVEVYFDVTENSFDIIQALLFCALI